MIWEVFVFEMMETCWFFENKTQFSIAWFFQSIFMVVGANMVQQQPNHNKTLQKLLKRSKFAFFNKRVKKQN
jgi:hypothetical protein